MHLWRFHRCAHFRSRRSEGLLVSGRGHTATPRSRGGAPPTEVGRGGCLGGGEGWRRVRSEETRASEREREGRDRRRRQLLLLLLRRRRRRRRCAAPPSMATAAGGWEIEPWLDVGRDQTYAAWAVLSQWRWLACGPRSPQAALPPVSDSQRRKAYLYAHSRRVADRDAPPSPPRAWYSPRYPLLPERAGDTPGGEPVDVCFALRRALRVRGPAAVARLQDTLWQWSAYARESAAERAGIEGVATMVQAAVRGFLERRRHRQRMRTAREQRVSAYVVAHWRAFAARKIEWRRRVADFARGEQQAREQERAASLIGARYRGHRQRQEMQRAGGRREWARARRERSERRERELASAARVEKSRGAGQEEADVRANESAHAPASTR